MAPRLGCAASSQRRHVASVVGSTPIRPARGMGNTMATVMVKSSTKPGPGRARAQDTDRHVGARMRERRIMLGLTQHQVAELIGVTYQQAHKYEKGINRIASLLPTPRSTSI